MCPHIYTELSLTGPTSSFKNENNQLVELGERIEMRTGGGRVWRRGPAPQIQIDSDLQKMKYMVT